MTLQDRVIIVAGGGRDIGAACAYDLAAKGAKVLITYHASGEGAKTVADNIKQNGGQAEVVQADLTNAEQVADCVKQTLKYFKKIDGLVHVAGGLIARKKITEMTLAHWRHVMDVNMTSLFLMSQAVIPHLSGKGSIVTFASQAARDGGGGGLFLMLALKALL